MRTPADALRDPRPGDVVIYGPQWQRERVDVTNILDDGTVQGWMAGNIQVIFTKQQWSGWMHDAEVLHVAQEGGAL